MALRSQWLIVAVVLVNQAVALAQAPTTFRRRHPSDVIRLASFEPRERREPAPTQEQLYRWRKAIQSLRAIAVLVGNERFAEAEQELAKVLPQLSPPYNRDLDTVLNQLKYFREATAPDPHVLHAHTKWDQPDWLHLQCQVLAEICLKLGGRDEAFAYVKRAVEAKGPSHESSQWIWQVLQQYNLTFERVQELKGIVANPESRADCDRVLSFREPNDPEYRFNYHEPKSLAVNLAVLDDLHRHLENLLSADEKRDIYLTTIFVLHCAKCTAERDAWQSKVLIDLPHDQEACGSVLLDRGREAYNTGELEVAFVQFDKIRRKYPESSSYPWALGKLGAIEQVRRNYPAAIANYRAMFAKVAKDTEREPYDRGSLPHDLLHFSAVGLSHCYEATGDFSAALEWAEASRDHYHGWPRATCGMGMEEEEHKFEIWKARLLSRGGKPAEAIKLLEQMLQYGSFFGSWYPIEAAPLYVQIHRDHQQLDLLPARLKAMREESAAWHKKLKIESDGNNGYLQAVERHWQIAQAAENRDLATLWDQFPTSDSNGVFHTLFRQGASRHVRQAIEALVAMPETSGPFLLQKLRGTRQDQAWAIVVLAKMQHADAPRLLERAAARVFSAGYEESPFSKEFPRDLCYAIWLNTDGAGPLVKKYGIGATNYYFGRQEVSQVVERNPASPEY